MKLNKLKLNDFGRFSNKEIVLKPNLNVIKGNNESGKSTIQKFIMCMLYGIDKDRRVNKFPDYDRFFPWGKSSFSGKISYTLDDGKYYEVFRDFTKKDPVVYNENAEDITNEFSKNSNGSIFFEEQTGIDSQTMLSSMVTEQSNVVLDQASENLVIQRIANMVDTGDENNSFEKAQEKIIGKRNKNVGTDKTRKSPINLLKIEKQKLEEEKEELERYSYEQYEIEEKIIETKSKKEKDELLLQFAQEFKKILNRDVDLKSKIEVYNESIRKNEEGEKDLKNIENEITEKLKKTEEKYNELLKIEREKEEQKNQKIQELNGKNQKNKKMCLLIGLLFTLLGIGLIFANLIPVSIACFLVAVICFASKGIKDKKIKKEIDEYLKPEDNQELENQKNEIDTIKNELRDIRVKKDVLEKDSIEKNNDIKELKLKQEENNEKAVEELINKYSTITEDEYGEILNPDKIDNKIEVLQNINNEDEVELQKYEYRKQIILPQIERIAEVEERLELLCEKKQELDKEAEAFSVALEVLEQAYKEMKENVIPRLTDTLSSAISKISNGKYSKVVTSDKDGILVEKENGEYVPANVLSIGTVDQLYLSLRFAIVNEASSQNMPIILDEPFAFYDKDRLTNILKYMIDEFANTQVILFTCTNREIEILNELNFEYNLIEL